MKRMTIFIVLLLTLMTSETRGQGSAYRSAEIVRISESDSIQTQLFATGDVIEVFGWLGNDFISASESLIITGEIMDDAIVVGEKVMMLGTIYDLFAGAGELVVIDGLIHGDVFAAGATIRITENALIKGNANLAGQRILFEGGMIEGNLKAAGNQLELNGAVQKKVELYSHKINFGPNYIADLGTDIYSDRPVYHENLGTLPENLYINVKSPDILELLIFKSGLYLSLFITGLVLIRIFSKTSKDIYKFSIEQFWKNTGVGLLTFLVYPLILIVLALLIFTLPISFLLLLLYGFLLLIGYLLVAMVLGVSSLRFLKKESQETSYYWGLFIGMILVAIIVNLPFLGWLFHAIFIFFGLGSLILYIWNIRTLSQVQTEATN
ncbi:polymer-forming cytoskeletal protein [Gracilimonas sp.]|uniref:polymer-forming cytoskeletal protein n=1 Tax=Gracilimonas sp. TaxID=1974203 RepID=UPI0025C37833|nr:polymer-forming cytoskeletal protein [Gracilimonas sp.]